jgi:hypothetical protein
LVHFGNGFFGCGAAGEGYETEATGAAGCVIGGEEDIGYFSECSKDFTELCVIRSVVKISYVELHLFSSSVSAGTCTWTVLLVIISGGSAIVCWCAFAISGWGTRS